MEPQANNVFVCIQIIFVMVARYFLTSCTVHRLTLDFAWYCHTYIRVPPWSYANFLSANIEGRGMGKCCFKNQNLKIEMSKQLRMNSLVIPVHFIIWKVTFLFFGEKGRFSVPPFISLMKNDLMLKWECSESRFFYYTVKNPLYSKNNWNGI